MAQQVSSRGAEFDAVSFYSAGSSSLFEPLHRCFLSGYWLRSSNGQLVRVEKLVRRDRVISATGREVEIMAIRKHDFCVGHTVMLCTSECSVTVSPSHRVLTKWQPRESMQAKDLKLGCNVVIGGGSLRPLISVEFNEEPCQMVELYFRPDDPVEAFPPLQSSILTMGQRQRQNARRGGMSRRRSHQQPDGDVTSDSCR